MGFFLFFFVRQEMSEFFVQTMLVHFCTKNSDMFTNLPSARKIRFEGRRSSRKDLAKLMFVSM